MLYVGYLGSSIIFSLVLAGLTIEKVDRQLAKNLQSWLYLSFAFLTLGIALGSWWAYRELGWGGYWFWDPVENISLMPLLLVPKYMLLLWFHLLCAFPKTDGHHRQQKKNRCVSQLQL